MRVLEIQGWIDKDDATGLSERLAAGLDPNLIYEDGETLLSRAAAKGSEAVVEILLAHGAFTDPFPVWPTPLVRAVEAGAVGIVEKLLAAGADVGREPWHEDVDLPLVSALYGKRWKIAEILIAHGAVEAADEPWFQEIFRYALKGRGKAQVVVLSALLSRVLKRFEGRSIPVSQGYLQTAASILERHVETRELASAVRDRVDVAKAAIDKIYDWAQDWVARHKEPDRLLKIVIEAPESVRPQVATTAFCLALDKQTVKGFEHLAQKIFEQGIDVNYMASDWTPLMSAAFHGQTEFVRQLIERGAELRAVSPESNDTPVDFARTGRINADAITEIESALRATSAPLDKAADLRLARLDAPQQVAERARLAVEAASENRWDRVERLIEQGVEINGRGRGGRTLMMYAATTGNREWVRRLLGLGAQLEDKDDRGITVMMWACDDSMEKFISSLEGTGQL